MDATYDLPHKTYIKSNTATVMRFLWFVSALLLILVVGLCVFVAFGRDDANHYHWDSSGQFYYTIEDGQATIVKFANQKAESFAVPANVNYGGSDYPVTTIGQQAFTNHRKLKSISLSDNITKIQGDSENQTGAFSGCVALNSVNLGNGITHIEKFAFKNCLALSAINFPTSIQFVGDRAFQNCLGLSTITLNSSGIFGTNCFENCLNVTTLELARDVIISEHTGLEAQVFANLAKLSHFVADGHSVYQVTANGDCLLKTTESPNDTVVLGGCGVTAVPSGITQICDWAWGRRASANLFVPATVTKIGANSFDCESICTDAVTKPVNWLTTTPVNTQAQLITFTAEGNSKTMYACLDAHGVPEVDYYDLFADLDTETPFKGWGIVTGGTCAADYHLPATSLTSLDGKVTEAGAYIDDSATRLKFTFGFWENFKMHYYRALSIINDPSTTYQYEVDELHELLQSDVDQIQAVLSDNTSAVDQEILASEDWWVGLQELVEQINSFEPSDLAETVSPNLTEELNQKLTEAESLIAVRERITAETGNNAWRGLRDTFENLTVNVSANSELNQEIAACENLQDRRNEYTKASWQKMQTQLALAKQVTENNLSISTVRENLAAARTNLREVTLPDHIASLNAWLSICLDLPEKNYRAYEYDRLMLELRMIIGNAENLNNNAKVDTALNNLQNRYRNLVPVNDTSTYQVDHTGIFNKKSLPYFITAVILFSGAVAAGAAAASMKKQLTQTQE